MTSTAVRARAVSWPVLIIASPLWIGMCMRRNWIVASAALILLGHAASAAAPGESRTQVGLLTCRLASPDTNGGNADAAFSETRKLLCAYRPENSGPEETYSGTLQMVGPQEQLAGPSVMIWIVVGTQTVAGVPGVLEQAYAAEPSAEAGRSPLLIGESNTSILLQTLADEQAGKGSEKQQRAMVISIDLKLQSTPT